WRVVAEVAAHANFPVRARRSAYLERAAHRPLFGRQAGSHRSQEGREPYLVSQRIRTYFGSGARPGPLGIRRSKSVVQDLIERRLNRSTIRVDFLLCRVNGEAHPR